MTFLKKLFWGSMILGGAAGGGYMTARNVECDGGNAASSSAVSAGYNGTVTHTPTWTPPTPPFDLRNCTTVDGADVRRRIGDAKADAANGAGDDARRDRLYSWQTAGTVGGSAVAAPSMVKLLKSCASALCGGCCRRCKKKVCGCCKSRGAADQPLIPAAGEVARHRL